MATGIGTGAALTYTGFSYPILEMRLDGQERPAVNASHLGTTTWESFVQAERRNPGVVEIDYQWDPTIQPPLTSAAALGIAITNPDGGTSVIGSAYMIDNGITWPDEEMMNGRARFQITGALTWDVTP